MQENPNSGLKFLSVEVKNFKNITARQIDINGLSFMVIGKNAAGKSSLIQALSGSVDSSNIPTKAIKEGEEKGMIETVIGGTLDGKSKKYTITTYFTPGKQTGRLVITNEQGEKIKGPSTFLKSLIGVVSFDITGFLHAKKDAMLKMLKDLTGCKVQIDMINMDITKKKAEKKVRKERAESLEGSVDNKGYTPEEMDLYSNPVPIEPLNEEMAKISKSVENWAIAEQKKAQFQSDIKTSEENIVKYKAEYDRLQTEVERLTQLQHDEVKKQTDANDIITKQKANIDLADKWFAARVKPDAEALSAKIAAATKHNEKHEKLVSYGNQQKEINKIKKEVLDDEEAIKKLETQVETIIAKSQLGIKGLSFSESEVFIDGLPLEENQINTARLFDIGVDIAIAQNPNLRVIFLHDASLFDTEGLKAIVKKVEEKGFQLIAEIVADNEDVEVRFTETDLN